MVSIPSQGALDDAYRAWRRANERGEQFFDRLMDGLEVVGDLMAKYCVENRAGAPPEA
jgi:hypothetical protein